MQDEELREQNAALRLQLSHMAQEASALRSRQEERDAELGAYRSQLALAKEESSTLRLIHEQTLTQHREEAAIFEARLNIASEDHRAVLVRIKVLESERRALTETSRSAAVQIEGYRTELARERTQKEVLQQVSEELTSEMVNMKMSSKHEATTLKELAARRAEEIDSVRR